MLKLVTVLLSVVIAGWSVESKAEDTMVYNLDGNSIRLYATTCTYTSVLSLIRDDIKATREFMKASVLWKGKLFEACWTVSSPTEVIILDQDGDSGFIPFNRVVKEQTG